jgi:uncharacterized membrane protein YphA (DoxX/SURF4 family)
MHSFPLLPSTTTSTARYWDYFILTARVLLAVTFISYGYSKLSGGQFGITAAEAAQPIHKISLFKLSWYLFNQEPFKSFVGVSQVVAGGLLLWNRTVLLGALLLLPIAVNVLIIDITYIKMSGFYWRLSYYIGLIFLILWHYRSQMRIALYALVDGIKPKFHFPWWAYMLLPVAAIAAELLGATPQVVVSFITNPSATMRDFEQLWNLLLRH